ncbi:hypothetical protein AALA22_10625 [Anaerovoracaceae bacterium 41-7]|uniref:hypothetical protein n=1 Tax=Emergencia sp. JLR.KK010 TaxID=3114296 RepID=UPI0030CB6508
MNKPNLLDRDLYGERILALYEDLNGILTNLDERMTLDLLMSLVYKSGFTDSLLFMNCLLT